MATINAIEVCNFINGEFVSCGTHIKSYSPASGLVNALIPDSNVDHVLEAVDAAQRAFKS